ncbi:hypothetical protein ACWEPR_33060 [Streptomyces sp. NPDC004290]|uniref:hypothetical protein n=1 Tax=unclassified Streptomyces TaxID=2593676 RepID=UPI002E7A4511|nr:hypothetical protein [Streptomyces sp. SP18ES09]MEE1815723.1 hypothetical protein [Streptomyces sp. SP18ES09]
MTTAQHLATIDLLRARAFPARPERAGSVDSGPGFHLGELATSEDFWEDDGSRRALVEEQYEAERDGLAALLTARWGPPEELSLWPVLERSMDGEEMAEPWPTLSCHTPELRLWRADGRWTGLGVSQWDKELPFQLLVVVTEVDPP